MNLSSQSSDDEIIRAALLELTINVLGFDRGLAKAARKGDLSRKSSEELVLIIKRHFENTEKIPQLLDRLQVEFPELKTFVDGQKLTSE